MMNSEVFQAALAATARIACCAVLVSCQKTPEKPTPPVQEPTTLEAEPVIKKEPPTPKEVVEKENPNPDAAEKSCEVKIDEYLKNIGNESHLVASEEVVQCCEEIITEGEKLKREQREKGEFVQLKDNFECCQILDFSVPGCTPWGPPTPPHMA